MLTTSINSGSTVPDSVRAGVLLAWHGQRSGLLSRSCYARERRTGKGITRKTPLSIVVEAVDRLHRIVAFIDCLGDSIEPIERGMGCNIDGRSHVSLYISGELDDIADLLDTMLPKR